MVATALDITPGLEIRIMRVHVSLVLRPFQENFAEERGRRKGLANNPDIFQECNIVVSVSHNTQVSAIQSVVHDRCWTTAVIVTVPQYG